MSKLAAAYKQFFQSPAGIEFMNFLDVAIETNYTSAENTPELARDYVQRAKGVRTVIEHIQSVTAERKQSRVS
jgi:hypothetical protein